MDGTVVLPKSAADDRRWNPEHQAGTAGKLALKEGRTRSRSRRSGCSRTRQDRGAPAMGSADPGGGRRPGPWPKSRSTQADARFVTGWTDYLRGLRPTTRFGPWLAVVDLPTHRVPPGRRPRLAKFKAAAVLAGPAPPRSGIRTALRAPRRQPAARGPVRLAHGPAGEPGDPLPDGCRPPRRVERGPGGDPEDGPANGHGAVGRGGGEVPGGEGGRSTAEPVRAGPRQLPDGRRGSPAGVPAHPGRRPPGPVRRDRRRGPTAGAEPDAVRAARREGRLELAEWIVFRNPSPEG